MRLGFIDSARHEYALDALDNAPLGGTQSAMFALGEALVAAGHEVWIAASGVLHDAVHRGLRGINLPHVLQHDLRLPPLDVAILVSAPLSAQEAPRLFARPTPLVHWHNNDALSPDAPRLARSAAQGHIAHFVFCSHFQASAFLARRRIPAERTSVIHNAVAPAFLRLFVSGEALQAAKDPELLVYTSAPHRGLEVLLRTVFPELRRRRPALRLEVYSGFSLRQGQRLLRDGRDATASYEALLAECAGMPGVTRVDGLAKPALAARLRVAAMLCYPCTFRESGPLTALEAMAAGCLLSTTQAGGLPEACAGFAALTPFRDGEPLDAGAFAETTLRMLEERDRDAQGVESHLREQIARVRAAHAPEVIAQRWLDLLKSLLARAPVISERPA